MGRLIRLIHIRNSRFGLDGCAPIACRAPFFERVFALYVALMVNSGILDECAKDLPPLVHCVHVPKRLVLNIQGCPGSISRIIAHI